MASTKNKAVGQKSELVCGVHKEIATVAESHRGLRYARIGNKGTAVKTEDAEDAMLKLHNMIRNFHPARSIPQYN